MPNPQTTPTDRTITNAPTTSPPSSPVSTPSPTTRTSRPRGTALDRELPHSLDAERALLGSMLLEEGAISEAISALEDVGAAAFWFEKHQKLYDLIVALWKENKPIDGVVIKDELTRRGTFEQLGGYEFLGSLVNAVPSALRVREYAKIVREKHLLRALIQATHKVQDAAFDDAVTAQEILDLAEKEVFDVTEKRVTGGARPFPDLVNDVFKRIDENLGKNILTGVSTGFLELDDITCGLQPGELIIVAARPSMGKTALGLNMAEHMALVDQLPVLFFSLEMSDQQLAQRVLCSRSGVNGQHLRRGRHSSRDMHLLQQAADLARDKPLFIDDTAGMSVLELRARTRIAHRKYSIQAVFVDYLQLMHNPGAESRQQEVAAMSRGLKALAKELSLPVIAMAQLNRNPEDRAANRPRMSDLRESGAIEQDADVVMLLHRESYYKIGEDQSADEDTRAELIIAKQRNGPVGKIDLVFDRQCTRFRTSAATQRFDDIAEAHRDDDISFP